MVKVTITIIVTIVTSTRNEYSLSIMHMFKKGWIKQAKHTL